MIDLGVAARKYKSINRDDSKEFSMRENLRFF